MRSIQTAVSTLAYEDEEANQRVLLIVNPRRVHDKQTLDVRHGEMK